MIRGARRKDKTTKDDGAPVRATISFPEDVYRALEDIARKKKVSIAWVVREASEHYVAKKLPVLRSSR
jgi:hypothetical protein